MLFIPGDRFRPLGTAFVVGAATFVERHPDGSGVLHLTFRCRLDSELLLRAELPFTRDGDNGSIESPWEGLERER